ncbi:MAG: glycerol-3-phosphate 1-O-acyltransferase PlsY [Clostridiales Family XIII bacterium]|nr:glycerol-3-phosphate 1-O-acyltransferase PlsY [Clostridiales Family XIII bacterium]
MFDFSSMDGKMIVIWIGACAVAYMLGNLSPATIISKASGVDIRKEGSGNPGTTNVLRVMGKKAALFTLLIDVLKGVAAVLIGRLLGGETLAVFCGFAAFLGHIFPAFYKFKGGKGIATAFGVLLTIHTVMALICLAIAALGFAISRRVSVGSLMTALSLPPVAWFFMPDYIVIYIVMAVIVLIRHRSNFQRLIRGEEPKISFKK